MSEQLRMLCILLLLVNIGFNLWIWFFKQSFHMFEKISFMRMIGSMITNLVETSMMREVSNETRRTQLIEASLRYTYVVNLFTTQFMYCIAEITLSLKREQQQQCFIIRYSACADEGVRPDPHRWRFSTNIRPITF